MKKITSLLAAIFLLMTIAAIYSCKGSKTAGTLLKFNLEKGKTYNYEIVWDLDQQVMGQDTKISLLGNYAMNVTEDKGNIKTVTGIYKNFKLYMKMMGMEINIDTDKPAEPMSETDLKANPMGIMNRVFAGIKGKEFTMKVDEEGKVLEVKGFEQIIHAMVDSIGMNEDMRNQMNISLKDQFNEQTIKDQFAQVFTIFPNKEVKVGDSWEKSFQMGGKMPAKYMTKYTVKEIEGDHVTLMANTTIGSDGGEMEIKGTQNGTLLVDGKTGLVLNAEFDQDMQTKVQDMEIKIKGKGEIKGMEK